MTNPTTIYRGLRVYDLPLELRVAGEVLEGRSYRALPFAPGTEIRSIVDIGAHVGLSATWFAGLYDNAQITCYEPSVESFALLEWNCPLARSIRAALDDQDGEAQMGEWQGPVTRSIRIGGRGETVRVMSAERAFAENHPQPDIIKLDTEGCEVPIVRSAIEYFQRAKGIYLEFHSWEDRLELDALLAPTHILTHATIGYSVNRGELAYVHKDAIDPRTRVWLRINP